MDLNTRLIGNTFYNKAGLEFRVNKFKYMNKYHVRFYECTFIKSGYTSIFRSDHILSGSIKDLYAPSVCGIGYIGSLSKKDYIDEYHVWRGMLLRCYDENSIGYKSYGAKGYYVCDRWHNFENFVKDLPTIEGYDYIKFHNKELHLDKDSKQFGNYIKVYSPETCVFLPKDINGSLTKQIPCIAYNENSNIFSNSYTEMATKLGVNQYQITHAASRFDRICHGYHIINIPALIIPAKIIK